MGAVDCSSHYDHTSLFERPGDVGTAGRMVAGTRQQSGAVELNAETGEASGNCQQSMLAGDPHLA